MTEDNRAALLDRAVRRSLGSLTSYAWVLGACTLIYVSVWRELVTRAAACGLWLLCVVQLGHYAGKMLAVRPAADFVAKRTTAPPAGVLPQASRVLAPHSYWPAHQSQADRLSRLQGYDPVPLARHLRFMTAVTGKDDPTSVLVGDSSPDPARVREALLDLANVRFVVQHAPRAAVPESFEWRPMDREPLALFARPPGTVGDSFVLFENRDALPRAFVLGQTRVIAKSADAVAGLAELQPRHELLMTAEFLPPGARADFAPAEIVEYTPNRVVVDAELSGVGYLVLTDSWYPGWTATDNGQPTSVIPANVAFRAVPLSAGKHRVEFRYRPIGFTSAAAVSIVAWLAVLSYPIVGFRRFSARPRDG